MENIRASLNDGNVKALGDAMAAFRTARQHNGLLTVDASCMKAAAGMVDDIDPRLFAELCSYCHPDDTFQCVVYGALNQCLPLLTYFLPALTSEAKAEVWPLFPILIEEKKYDVIHALRAEGIAPHRDDFTVWPLVVNAQFVELMQAMRGTNGRMNPLYVRPMVSYCETLLADASLSPERKSFTRTFLEAFQSDCAAIG
ncbi:helicase domain protein [Perkinsela sp. CCAP 1560/4]|nr:helicase domain protein [Perkinsela sp. CCAP 1560/4]|eukprot:KNH08718.1 helicase domain protein [Perkinsela sp. CCAP 1560/4]